MSDPLYMVQLSLGESALVRFLAHQGLNTNLDEDLGYGAHAWLRATFGELAPQPFRLFQSKPGHGELSLVGYTSASESALLEHAGCFAEPLALSVCDMRVGMATKSMPGVQAWKPGRRLGFEVLVSPVARSSVDGRERDFFLHEADKSGPGSGLQREAVYLAWLTERLGAAAHLEEARLMEFRLVSQLRQASPQSNGSPRKRRRLLRPRALVRGQMTVNDAERFAEVLAHGIGRHRAFGYGMLLLRPPR